MRLHGGGGSAQALCMSQRIDHDGFSHRFHAFFSYIMPYIPNM